MTATLLGLALTLGAPNLKDKENDKAPSIVGEWEVKSITSKGAIAPPGSGLRYTFTGDGQWVISRNGKPTSPTVERGFTEDPKPKQPTVDLVTSRPGGPETRIVGIFKIDGDTLTICGTLIPGADRPTKFEAPEGSGNILYVLKRPKNE